MRQFIPLFVLFGIAIFVLVIYFFFPDVWQHFRMSTYTQTPFVNTP